MDWTLERLDRIAPPKGPLVVVIMDGIGIGAGDEADAVARAFTPTLDHLRATFPYRTLRAHGKAVGLPYDSDMGNSEVGHNAIGAGRIFDQGAKLVNNAIADGSIFRGDAWMRLTRGCLERRGPLHFIGLLSNGNVHSHIDHLAALIREAAKLNIQEVYVHPLTDGRDVTDGTALDFVRQLEGILGEFDGHAGRRYRIASGGGRMFVTMDRYNADWRIVERGWNAHVHGEGARFRSATAAVGALRSGMENPSDQFIPPFVIVDDADAPVGPIRDGASVVFFNFRGDRAIQISRAFEDDLFPYFKRGVRPKVDYAGMMQYDGDFHIPKLFLVAPPQIDRTFGEYLARNAIRQFACSETQKYGHVTYFWNGNRGGKFDDALEDYREIKSDRVPFEQRPWMKAAEITDTVIRAMRGRSKYGLVRLNYANGDMVGHTGSIQSSIIAVETVDLCLGRLLREVGLRKGVAIVTADHGNADDMYERNKDGSFLVDPETGRPTARSSHSLNPVPFMIVDQARPDRWRLREDLPEAGLANIAATALGIMGFRAPQDYEPSLLA